MSRHSLLEEARQLAASETPLADMRRHAAVCRVALAYPHQYRAAMANLGFQSVYRVLNGIDGLSCERAFLPDGPTRAEMARTRTPLATLESQAPVASFDVLAFSCHFEEDYANVPLILDMARIPRRARDRDEGHPLVVIGGSAPLLNPEPLAPFADICVAGDGELTVPRLASALLSAPRRAAVLEALASEDGFYVPAFYEPRYQGKRFAGFDSPSGARHPIPIARGERIGYGGSPPQSALIAPRAEFKDKFLIEVSRGCDFGCRFCTSGYHYLPTRVATAEGVREAVEAASRHTSEVGLISTAIASVPGVAALIRDFAAKGIRVATSSIRIDRIDDELAQALAAAGRRTVTIAPETGSERVRRIMNKRLTNQDVLAAAERLAHAGIPNLKLYLMVGLPGEEMTDVAEMPPLVRQIRDILVGNARSRGFAGTVTASVNAFIPKPWTPFQWAAHERPEVLRQKLALLRRELSREPNVELQLMSERMARVQSYLARADRRAADALQGGSLSWRILGEVGVDVERELHAEREPHEPFPWEIFRHPVHRSYLALEWRRAKSAITTEACPAPDPDCHRCGAC